MKIIDCQQGTPEWFEARLGIPTASNFDKLITTKGAASKQAEKYLYKLAGERVSGIIEETYQNGAMERGRELEDEARKLYEFHTDKEVEQVGFCLGNGFGCSPDGLVGTDGGLEIKCPSMAVHVEYLLGGTIPTKYTQQVQGCMYVTGRQWWDFMSYSPCVKPLIVRVERDEAFIKSLKDALDEFCKKLKDVERRIK